MTFEALKWKAGPTGVVNTVLVSILFNYASSKCQNLPSQFYVHITQMMTKH